jgi:fatty acyl-CoA reductase
MEGSYSILDHFREGSVLLTGSSGYLGQLVLERLLRSTGVRKIYVLLRAKRGEDIHSRLRKMLENSVVMHLLRNNDVLRKVVPVAGDMTAPGLGISITDRHMLQLEVQTVIHCAADIRLENGIQELLLANYEVSQSTARIRSLVCR